MLHCGFHCIILLWVCWASQILPWIGVFIRFRKFLAIISSKNFFCSNLPFLLMGFWWPLCLVIWYYLIGPWGFVWFSPVFSFVFHRLDHFCWLSSQFAHFFLCRLYLRWAYLVKFSFQLLFNYRIAIWFSIIVSVYLWNSPVPSLKTSTHLFHRTCFPLI